MGDRRELHRSLTSASPRSRAHCRPRWSSAIGSCTTANTRSSASRHRPVIEGWASPSPATAPSPSRSASRSPPSTSARTRPTASDLFRLATRRSLPPTRPGIGLRALSIVDLAVWDVAAKLADPSIAGLLGGATRRCRPRRSSATRRRRWVPRRPASRRPSCTTRDGGGSRRRSRPVRSCPPIACAPPGLRRRTPGSAGRGVGLRRCRRRRRVRRVDRDVGLGWFEDVFPPGDAGLVRQLRERIAVPIAMGDEQGGSYYPEALLQRRCRRRRAHRPDVHGRHHRRTPGDRPLPRCRACLRPAHVRPRPQPGVRGARLRRTCRSSGACRGPGRSLRRQPRPASDRRREDGAASRQPGFGSLLDARAGRPRSSTTIHTTSSTSSNIKGDIVNIQREQRLQSPALPGPLRRPRCRPRRRRIAPVRGGHAPRRHRHDRARELRPAAPSTRCATPARR